MFRVILDGILTLEGDNEVKGWDTLQDTLSRDKERKGLLLTQDAKLTFLGIGYEYVRDIYYSGSCNEIYIDIQESYKNTWKTIHKGIIKVPAIKIFEWIPAIETTVEDNSFFARIEHNKSLETFLYSESSKNNEPITPAEFYQIEMFKPSDGTAYPPIGSWGLTGFRVFEAFKHLVANISDGEVDFASDVLDIGGDWEGLSIINGYTIRFATADPWLEEDFKDNLPKLSFQKLLEEVYKKKNIAFRIETGGAKPVLRIENADALFSGKNEKVKFLNIDKITTQVVMEELYSTIRLGGDILTASEVDATTLSFASSSEWVAFIRETWTIEGQCNFDRHFDLQGDFIVDSNIIEDVLVKANSNYDDRWFVIETTVTDPNNGVAILGDPFVSAPPYAYNPGLRNSEVANNFLGYIPNSVVQNLSQNTGGLFEASKDDTELLTVAQVGFLALGAPVFPTVVSPTTWADLVAPNDNNTPAVKPPTFDDGNNYDNTTGEYTIPFGGKFTFNISNVKAETFNSNYRFYLAIARYDAGNTLQQYQALNHYMPLPGIYNFGLNATFVCNGGDIIRFYYQAGKVGNFSQTPWQVKWYGGTRLECTAIEGQGGEYLGSDPANYKNQTHEFKDYPLSKEDFETILNNQTDSFTFAMYGQKERHGWIKSLKYKRKESKADIILLTSPNTNA